jgi:thiazole synthase ThiGH ThiG subunit
LVTMLELDRRSTPDGAPRRASSLLGCWWAAYVGVIVPGIGLAVSAMPRFADEVNRISGTRGDTVLDLTATAHAAAPWFLVTGIVYAVAAGLAILVVRRIDESQRAFAATPFSFVPVPMRPDALA